MDFEDPTLFKRSEKGQKITKNTAPQWAKLRFNNMSIDISRKIIVGRDSACAVCFADDTMVSRRHAEIEIIGDSCYVTDLGSTNGTYVNKNPVPKGKRLKLKAGDVIRIGSQCLKLD